MIARDQNQSAAIKHEHLDWLHLDGAAVAFREAFLPLAQANSLLLDLLDMAGWQQHQIRLFGRYLPEPRLGIWFSDPGIDYSYSGRRCTQTAWPECLTRLRLQLQQRLGFDCNSVLGNLYRHGDDYMGWHSDDERDLGADPVIASVSLGASRDFVLRRKCDHQHKLSWTLSHGSLLLMAGRTQRDWQHAVPRRKRIGTPRINLTFRTIIHAADGS
ncbi:MAG: alpha-ketoglutarate-dependent dioxygenase AlkB [Gammaproteobacteria bacterium]|jgi:alkylated DNA repair dioxygenase AlkB|nr:alpha-ketoglutarate-dependent dioxygenase AlkB [Gammaproteobacteria bacterium]